MAVGSRVEPATLVRLKCYEYNLKFVKCQAKRPENMKHFYFKILLHFGGEKAIITNPF
jgi:hypothetical protein